MSSYRTQFGAAAAYYGQSDTGTNWPANMGGSNGVNAFMVGIAGTYLTGVSVSALPRRVIGVYSNISNFPNTFSNRVLSGGRQIPGRLGPLAASFPISNPADARPY